MRHITQLTKSFLLMVLLVTPLSADTSSLSWVKRLPADTLFVARVHDLDASLVTMDQFLLGTFPLSLKVFVPQSLTGSLGMAAMEQIDLSRPIIICGIGETSQEGMPPGFVPAVFLPVKNLALWAGSDPGEDGSYALQLGPAAQGTKVAAWGIEQYALMVPQEKAALGLKLKEQIMTESSDSLGTLLGEDSLIQAEASTLWLFANIQSSSALYLPFMTQFLGQMQQGMAAMNPTGTEATPDDAQDLVAIYETLLKRFSEEVRTQAISINITEQALRLASHTQPVANSQLASVLQDTEAPESKAPLALMPDGALSNGVMQLNLPLWRFFTQLGMDIMKAVVPTSSEATLNELFPKIQGIWNMTGDYAVSSLFPDPQSMPPYGFTYVIQTSHGESFIQELKGIIQLILDSQIFSAYENLGLKMEVTQSVEPTDFNGYPLHTLTMATSAASENLPPETQAMLAQMPSMEYHFTHTGNTVVFISGSGWETKLPEVLSLLESGDLSAPPTETREAMTNLSSEKQYEVMGTYNYVRLIQAFSAIGGQASGNPSLMANIPTVSNLAYAMKVGTGQLQHEIVLPKKHFSEIAGGIQAMLMASMMQPPPHATMNEESNASMNTTAPME